MTKEDLIDELVKSGYLKDNRLLEAFLYVDRKDFVLEEDKDIAYQNTPLPIGYGQTISQPLTVAFMLELLEPKRGEKILDVGTGSGWQAALLAYLVKDEETGEGKVISIERIEELKNFAEKNISKYEDLKNNVVLVKGNGALGYKKEAPYDKIIAAASGSRVPLSFKRQLKVGGRIVMPIRESIVVLDKVGNNEFKKREFFGFVFVPLLGL
jgi:protein-L-isoaspartate(D-aspartate) O-methyltransferase